MRIRSGEGSGIPDRRGLASARAQAANPKIGAVIDALARKAAAAVVTPATEALEQRRRMFG
jgi:hypothetical protein